jgi:cation transport ATPase
VREAKDRRIPLAAVQDFANVAGKGIRGRLEDSAVAVGNLRLMRSLPRFCRRRKRSA